MTAREKPVVGWEGLYKVDDQGHVFSLPRRARNGRGFRDYPGRRLRPNLISGYCQYILSGHGVKQAVLGHIVVLEAFVGPCPPGMESRHLNNRRADNWLSNICWGTRAENSQDRVLSGSSRGSRNPASKLTTEHVLDIRARLSAGQHPRDIAATFQVSESCIKSIRNRVNWSWLADPAPAAT